MGAHGRRGLTAKIPDPSNVNVTNVTISGGDSGWSVSHGSGVTTIANSTTYGGGSTIHMPTITWSVTTTGVFSEYPLRNPGADALGLAAGPDGNIWFGQEAPSAIANVTPSGVFTEYATPTIDARPLAVVAGSDKRMWFTEQEAGQIGAVTMTGEITEYAIPTAGSSPLGIALGRDGGIWFVEDDANEIGRLEPG